MACFNPLLADERKRKRDELLAATERQLQRIASEVQRRTKRRLTKTEIALKVGRVAHRYKVAKHFELTIEDHRFEWKRKEASIQQEEALDGIYVIRTSETKRALSSKDAVRSYIECYPFCGTLIGLNQDWPFDTGSRQCASLSFHYPRLCCRLSIFHGHQNSSLLCFCCCFLSVS